MPEYENRWLVVLDFSDGFGIIMTRGDNMQRLGFIHDMMDVKVLVLFVSARSNYPLDMQQLYELCYQDDCLSYFDVCTAVPKWSIPAIWSMPERIST